MHWPTALRSPKAPPLSIPATHRGALLGVGLLNALLQQLDGLVDGQHARQLEEHGLHDHVDVLAQADLVSGSAGVDDVKLRLQLGQLTLDLRKSEQVEAKSSNVRPGQIQAQK